jgi:hypothetical protein
MFMEQPSRRTLCISNEDISECTWQGQFGWCQFQQEDAGARVPLRDKSDFGVEGCGTRQSICTKEKSTGTIRHGSKVREDAVEYICISAYHDQSPNSHHSVPQVT